MGSMQHEPMMRVSPLWGLGTEPLVETQGAELLEDESLLSIFIQKQTKS